MGLSAQNVAIVPTPSGVLDGHYPDGNDGTAAVPLIWANIPPFTAQQVGVPLSVDLFTLYLTQAGGATASVGVGALSGGWALSSSGILTYSGVGEGTGTIRVRATIVGQPTCDSNLFTFESIATVVSADTLAPTIPTNPSLVSKTATTVTVTSDVPSDVPTFLIPADGYKETRWFNEGLIDGVTSFGKGVRQRMTIQNVAASNGRRMPLGFLSTVSKSQRDSAGGVPSYMVGPGITAVAIRYRWGPDLEPGAAGDYTFTARMDGEVAQAQALGVKIIVMIEVRTFDAGGGNPQPNPMPVYLQPYSSWFTAADIATVTGTTTSGSKVITAVSSTANIVNGGALSVRGGGGTADRVAIPYSARVVSHTANTITMDLAATASGTWAATFNNANPPQPIGGVTYGEVPLGYQGWRWHPSVLAAFKNLCDAIGKRYDNNSTYGTTFAGIATQETSNGGIDTGVGGYSTSNYADALILEDTYISNACPHGRHWFYFNFMAGTGAATQLQRVVDAFVTNGTGAVVGFPDLVNGDGGTNNITGNVYPIVKSYHNNGGYTFGCVQQSEWSGNGKPAQNEYMSELYNYGTSSNTYPTTGYPATVKDWRTGSPLKLDAIIYNVQQGDNTLGEQFSTTIIGTNGIAKTNATPIGTLQPATGIVMTPGIVTQTGVDYTVLSYGTGINTNDDQWAAANESVNGDVTVIFKLAGLAGGDLTSGAVMGVSLRDAIGISARSVYMVATSTQLRTRYRLTPGNPVTGIVDTNSQGWNVANYGKITRVGDLFSFYYSIDTLTWTAVGSVTLTMVPSIFIQFFAGTTGTTSVTATFQQVNIQQLAKLNHTFTGLTTATLYHFTAKGRDLANNDSNASAVLAVTTS